MPFSRYSDDGMQEESARGSKIGDTIRKAMASPSRQKCSGTVSATANGARRTALTDEPNTIGKATQVTSLRRASRR